MPYKTVVLLFFLISIDTIIAINSSKVLAKKTKALCSPRIKIKGCKNDEINRLYTYYQYNQGVEVIPGCPNNAMEEIIWTLYYVEEKKYFNLEKYNNKMTLSISPEEYSPGDYIMTVKIKEAGGNIGTEKCNYRFICDPAIIIIKYGMSRRVTSGTMFKVDLTQSINFDKKHPLKPVWARSCKLLNDEECKKLAKCTPEGGVKTSMVFETLLDKCHESHINKVTIKHDRVNLTGFQIVKSVEQVYVDIEVVCDKNCDRDGSRYTNPSLPTMVKLICYSNCTYLKVKNWELREAPNGIPNNKPENSTNYKILENNRMYIPANFFKRNTRYWIKCVIEGGSSSKELITTPKIIPPTCDIQPKSGQSMTTVFIVKCITSGHLATYAPFYQLHQDSTNGARKDVMLAASAFNEFEVIIGAVKNQPQQKLIIAGHDNCYNHFEVTLDEITVEPIDLNEKNIEVHLKKIEKMYNEGNEELAGKYVQALFTEINNNKFSSPVINNAYSRIMTCMNKIDIDNIYPYKQIITLLPQFYKSDQLDSNTKKQLSEFCKHLSKIQLSSTLKSRYAAGAEKEVKKFIGYTKTCADVLMGIKDDEDEINITTPEYIIKEPAIEETYPNYDSVFTNSQIEKVKQNAMDNILSSSKALAATLSTGQFYNKVHEHFESAVVINDGSSWPGKEITVNRTTIKVLNNVGKYKDDAIAAVITGYKQELLKSEKVKLDTNIVDVNFLVTKNGEQVKVPLKFEINLDIKINIKSNNFNISVIESYDDWKDHISINVHRMETKQDSQYVCSIQNAKSSDKLQVVLIIGRRPHLDDFNKNSVHLIDGSKTKKYDINFQSDLEGDVFAYLGVLPHPDMLKESKELSMSYNVTFIEEVCLIFDPIPYNWVPGPCKANIFNEDSSTKIKCTCMHSSLFGANVNNVENKIDFVLAIEFTTEPFENYTILIFVSITFACYCIALCFYQKRYKVMGGRDRVFFMSDNLKNDRYGYLVIVKTGSINNSGTTSNIAFKLKGDRFTCKPHVFNYPDPQKRLLQIGTTDCYILSTERYIGKIKEIHLWFDSIGLRPSWYCERITVIDLQTREYYYFFVEKWLSVLRSERIQIQIEASKNVYASTKDVAHHLRKCVRVYAGAFHTWNILNKSHDYLFSYPERLTVILSIIYTTYVLNIFFLYVPNMKMSDIYGYGEVKFHFSMVVSAIGSSLLACLLNYPFIFFFRNSEKLSSNILLITTPTLYSYKCNVITWYIIIGYLVTCMSYLVIFGFWVSFNTTLVWFINTTISLVASIIVVDNIYIIAMRLILLKLKRLHVEIANISEILKQAEIQRRILFGKFGEVMLRPYFKKHYRVMHRDDVTLAKSKETARIDVGDLFKEMCLFIIFICILYFILFADMDYLIYTSNVQMRRMLAPYSWENSLKSIYSINDIYDYINNTVLNAVHSVHWYGRYNSLDGGQMKDFKSKILGVVQLRQQRRSQRCRVPYELGDLNILCHNNAPVFDNWTYYDGSEISSSLGKLQMYSGNGYTTLLGRTLYNSYYIMNTLRRNNWIDINTKVLIIEFWTYNVNFNVFNAVRVIFERNESGFIVISISIITARYIQSSFTMEVLIILAVLTIILIVLIMLGKRLIKTIRKISYLKSFWNLVDIVILTLCVAIITLFFMKKIILVKTLNQLLESDRNEFINYFNLNDISQMNVIFASFLLCLATIKLWKYLRFGAIFQEMEHTVKLCAIPMCAASGYHLWTVITFGWYFHIMLGTNVYKFCTFFETMKHLITSYVDVQRIKNYMPFIDKFTVIMFLMYDVMTVTFTTIYLTIIICAFQESKKHYSNRKSAYTIKNYFIDEAKYLTEMSKMQYKRLRAGGDNDEEKIDLLVYPKEDCKLYADSVSMTTSALDLMQILSMGVMRNLKKMARQKTQSNELSDNDFELLARIFIQMYKCKTETAVTKVLFLHGEDPITNKIKFVEYSKMLEIETILKQLLHGLEQEDAYEDKEMIIHMNYDKRLDGFKETIDAMKTIINHIRIV